MAAGEKAVAVDETAKTGQVSRVVQMEVREMVERAA